MLILKEEFNFNFCLFQILFQSFLDNYLYLITIFQRFINYVTNYYLEINNEKFEH